MIMRGGNKWSSTQGRCRKTQKITKLSVKCLNDFIETTNLYVNFDDCFKEFNAVLINVYVGARKPKGEQFKKTV